MDVQFSMNNAYLLIPVYAFDNGMYIKKIAASYERFGYFLIAIYLLLEEINFP